MTLQAPSGVDQVSRIVRTFNVSPFLGGSDLSYGLHLIWHVGVKSSGFLEKCSLRRQPSNQCRINVLSLNETRFDESVSDNEVYIPGYEIIRVIENMMVGLVGAFVSMFTLV